MKKYDKRHNELDKAWEAYCKQVDEIVEHEFETELKPFLEKYNLTFAAGNGAFHIGYTDKTPLWFVHKYHGYYEGSIEPECLNSTLQYILFLPIEGMNNTLGSLMPDYPKED